MNIWQRNRLLATSLSLALALLLAMAACSESESPTNTPSPTATSAPAATATPTPPPPTPTQAPTNTPEPTSTSAPEPTATPTVAPTATSEPTATPEPAPTAEPAPETYPLTVTDMLRRPVEIPAKPERIVSISPTATEMLYVAGGTAIARDTSSTFPAEVVDLPALGGAYSPSFEAIAAQGADLIIIEALTQARFLEPLSQLGAPVVAVRATSLDDVTAGIRLIGQIIDNEEAADQAAQSIADRVSSSIEGLEGGRSVVILTADADRNLYVAKPQSYPGAIAAMLQLANLAAELPDSGTFPGFALVSRRAAADHGPGLPVHDHARASTRRRGSPRCCRCCPASPSCRPYRAGSCTR